MHRQRGARGRRVYAGGPVPLLLAASWPPAKRAKPAARRVGAVAAPPLVPVPRARTRARARGRPAPSIVPVPVPAVSACAWCRPHARACMRHRSRVHQDEASPQPSRTCMHAVLLHPASRISAPCCTLHAAHIADLGEALRSRRTLSREGLRAGLSLESLRSRLRSCKRHMRATKERTERGLVAQISKRCPASRALDVSSAHVLSVVATAALVIARRRVALAHCCKWCGRAGTEGGRALAGLQQIGSSKVLAYCVAANTEDQAGGSLLTRAWRRRRGVTAGVRCTVYKPASCSWAWRPPGAARLVLRRAGPRSRRQSAT